VPGRYYALQRSIYLPTEQWDLEAVVLAAPGTTQARFIFAQPQPKQNAFYRAVILP
jgi:hypothetical protein